MLAIAVAACRGGDDRPGSDGSSVDTSPGPTGDTSAPLECDPTEAELDGRDGDCDGWADELGEWPLLTDDATLVFTGPEPLWGEHVTVGRAADGTGVDRRGR